MSYHVIPMLDVAGAATGKNRDCSKMPPLPDVHPLSDADSKHPTLHDPAHP